MSVSVPFHDWLENYKILKKISAARSWLVGWLVGWSVSWMVS